MTAMIGVHGTPYDAHPYTKSTFQPFKTCRPSSAFPLVHHYRAVLACGP